MNVARNIFTSVIFLFNLLFYVAKMEEKFKTSCCNPFSIKSHTIKKGLRPINDTIIEKLPSLTYVTGMVCTNCRKRIGKLSSVNRKFLHIFSFLINMFLLGTS